MLEQLVPLVVISPAALDFRAIYVGDEVHDTLVLDSIGTAPLDVLGLNVDADFDAFTLTSPTADAAPDVLTPGRSIELVVTFAPPSPGAFAATLIAESNAQNLERIELPLTGLALEPLACPPEEPCRTFSFDSRAGACIETLVDAPCDDGSACTDGERCVQGECLGQALECPVPNACTRGLCDPVSGCFLAPDDSLCGDDGDTCTEESCDVERGCVVVVRPDGSPCAAFQGCQAASLCVSGACTSFPIPNGTPCIDGDYCTVGDACSEGTCAGLRIERDPEVVADVRSFGAYSGVMAFLDDDTLLFVDRALSTGAGTLTVVDIGIQLTAIAELRLLQGALELPRVAMAVPGGAVLVTATGIVQAVAIGADATPSLAGSLSVSGSQNAAAIDNVVWICAGPTLTAVDVGDLMAPTIASTTAISSCGDLAADAVTGTIYIALGDHLSVFDARDPAAPVALADMAADGMQLAQVAASGDLVAAGGPWGVTLFVEGSIAAGIEPVLAGFGVFDLAIADGQLALVQQISIQDGASPLQIELYDVAEPTTPSLIASRLTTGVRVDIRAHHAFVFANHVSVFRTDVADSLAAVVGRGLGSVGDLTMLAPNTLVGVASNNVHQLSITEPPTISFDASGYLPVVADLVAVGSLGTAPILVSRFEAYPSSSGNLPSDATIVNANSIAFPVTSGIRALDGLDGLRVIASDGLRLFSASSFPAAGECEFGICASPDRREFRVEVHDLGAAALTFDAPIPRIGGNILAAPVVDAIPFNMAIAGGRMAVALINSSSGAVLVPEGLALVDVSQPDQPALVATTVPFSELPASVSLKVSGDRIAVTGGSGLVVYDAILRHLGLPDEPLPLSKARGPPQPDLHFA